MRYTIEKMDEAWAGIISEWRYDGSYSFYDMDDTNETIEELCDGSYYSVLDDNGGIVGFFCFGASAQVPPGRRFGVYESKNYTDIGLGMRPDLCGQGLGTDFLRQGMTFALRQLSAENFRLTVASFNKRAIKAYEKVGFVKANSFEIILKKDNIETNEKLEFEVMLCAGKEVNNEQ